MLVLTPEDFDSLLAEPVAGSAGRRPKGDLRKRLSAWARSVHKRLERQDLPLVPMNLAERLVVADRPGIERICETVALVRVDSDAEVPSGRSRPRSSAAGAPRPDVQTARSRRAALILRVDATRVEVGLEILSSARGDLDYLFDLLSTAPAFAADELVDAVRALPEQFGLRLGPESVAACDTATAQGLRSIVSRARADRRTLWLGWTLTKELALANHEIVGEQLADALVALGPVYLLATPPEGDWAKRASAPMPGRSRVGRAAVTAGRKAPAGPRLSRSGSPSGRGANPRRRPPPAAVGAEVGGLSAGMKVRVRSGAFAEKTGLVTAVDGRGVRVLFGLLATRFGQDDLEPVVENKDRPTLSSSHRRAASSRKPR